MASFFSIKNIDEIDFAKLVRQLPNRPSRWDPFSVQGKYIRAILASYPVLLENDINTPQRLAHFLGQGLVETNYLRARAEDLNYSFATLKRLFGRKFANDEEIRAYAGNAEKIANRVYANRMWNGPEESGDGYRYRGRGFFQITGKENYTKFSDIAGVDLVANPKVLEDDLELSVRVAAAYFKKTGLAAYADRDDIAGVSRGINRPEGPGSPTPANHEADRIDWTRRAQQLVSDPKALLKTNLGTDLALGATGDGVVELQTWLDALGYAVGRADGIFGPATRRAVLAFQDERALPVTGIVDAATRATLRNALDLPAAPGESPADAAVPTPAPAEPAPPPATPPVAELSPPAVETTPAPAPEPPVIEAQTPAEPTPPPLEAAPDPAPADALEAPIEEAAPPAPPAAAPLIFQPPAAESAPPDQTDSRPPAG